MIAYKLFRQLKDGSIASLFINKINRPKTGIWLQAENHPTKGYQVRPGWHTLLQPNAPHLSLKDRIWYVVEIDDYTFFDRPRSQGGKWALAQQIKILYPIKTKGDQMKTYFYYIRDDNNKPITTFCILVDNTRTAVGKATCSPKDNVQKSTGRAIAQNRAEQALKQKRNIAHDKNGSPKGWYNPIFTAHELNIIRNSK